MSTFPVAKRLLDATAGQHPIISIVFDLNPAEFATPAARAIQATSLIDAAHNLERADETLSHDARQAVRADLERVDAYLGSADFPVNGAGALAIYASQGDELFETVVLPQSMASVVYLAREPYLEPLVTEAASQRWRALLVSERDVTIYDGSGGRTTEKGHGSDYVRSQSGGNDERGHDQDIDGHLIQVAQLLADDARADRFDVLVIGGPVQAVSALEGRLVEDVRNRLLGQRLEVDPSAVHETEIAAKVSELLRIAHAQEQEQTLAHFSDQLEAGDKQAGGRRAVAGVADVLEALAEQRVATLVLASDFHAAGTRCPHDGSLYGFEVSSCPADGTETVPVADLRGPMIAAAIRQSAEVIVSDEPAPVQDAPDHAVGALLRF
jgi:hypothetical protein